MSDKFKGKYRGQTFRLKNWDYANEGAYFITICTQDREHFFGEIENEKMVLTETGRLAEKYWAEIPKQFPFIKLGEFVIMPNHVHGILIIDHGEGHGRDGGFHDGDDGFYCRDAINRIPTIKTKTKTTTIKINTNNPKINGGFAGNKNPMFHDSISRVIRWYKGRCTFEIRKINVDFKWQSLFYDNIIWNQQSFYKIEQYIMNNPKKWSEDRFSK